jgi:hypothetical protein
VIQTYRDAAVPAPTVRDVMYELRGRYGYKKTTAFNRKVYRLLSKMRRARLIGFDEIDDDSPTMATGRGYDDPAHFWRGVEIRASAFGRDLMQGQPQRVIVLTEGAGKVRQFRSVTGRYDIPVYSGGGWESVRLKHDLAKDAADDWGGTGLPTLALHCGDFDPDGVAIFESGIDDVRAFVSDLAGVGPDAAAGIFQVERLMLTEDQIAEQVPDEGVDAIDRSKIKAKDWRGQNWPYDYKCELEALRLPDRLEVLRSRLIQLVDQDQLQAVREQGRAERDEIKGVVARILAGSKVRTST